MDYTLNFIKDKTNNFIPDIALVLGSGLGSFTDGLDGLSIPYAEIKGFSKSSVQGHKGALFFYEKNEKKVVVMQGRLHFYEGYKMEDVTFPIKVLRKLGVKKIILTNAAGALNKNLAPGDLMLIKDHINLMGTNPLIGANDDSSGERFPDMSEVYDFELREIAKNSAKMTGIDLKEGVYAATTGPSYETPSEVKMLNLMGADVVGMSTVPEAIVANWCHMRVLGLSLISNYASGVSENKLNHKEVIEAGEKAKEKVKTLLNSIVDSL